MQLRSTVIAIGLVLLGTASDATAKPGRRVSRRRASKSKTKAKQDGPNLEYERFRKQIEFQVEAKRDQQIAGIKRLLELGPKRSEIPELKFRLAELYFERSRFHFFRGYELDDAIEAARTPGEKDSLKKQKSEELKKSKAWAKSAREIYRDIRKKYRRFKRMPEVLFALGQSYWSEGSRKDAVEVYAELIRRFKKHPLVSEAWLAFGEFYFDQGDVVKALKSFEKAARDKGSRVYGFALYKQAWCYYNLSKWRDALRKFKATVFYSQLAQQMSGENRIALGREAQKDFVRTYAHVGTPTRAKYILADLLGEKDCSSRTCLKMIGQLAQLWDDGGFFEEAVALYRWLIKTSPDGTKSPYYQSRVLKLVSKGAHSSDKARTVREAKRFATLLVKARGQLENRGPKDRQQAEEDIKKAERSAEETVRRLAQFWNREAKRNRQRRTYRFALQMYEQYLALFPKEKHVYEVRFQLADVYYKVERFDDAAKAYRATVDADPKGKYLVGAATDHVLAIEEHLKDLNLKRPKASDSPLPIHPAHQRLVDACDRYVKFVPPAKAKKRTAVQYKAAYVFYTYSHFDEALRRLEQVVAEAPQAEEAETAANLICDVHNYRTDWPALAKASSRFLANDALLKGRKGLRSELSKFQEYARFQLILQLEADVKSGMGGTTLDVAQAYEKYQAAFPKSENADKALFNASVAYDQAGKPKEATEARQRLLRAYPKSPLGADVAYYLAQSQANQTNFRRAAAAFLRFAEKYPKDKRARDSLFNAAVFYAGTGRVKKGNALRATYLEKYASGKKDAAERERVSFAMARDLEEVGAYRDAVRGYSSFAKRFGKSDLFWEAMWREAEIREERLRQARAARTIKGKILGTYIYRSRRRVPMPKIAKLYASKVAFEEADADFKAYERERIATPNLRNPRIFRRSLARKAAVRDRLIARYSKVVTTYRQAESSIASLARIADAWSHFTEAVLRVPCPRGITQEACQLVKAGLEEQVAPSREAALKGYRTCVQKSNELNTFTRYSTRCVRTLERLAPEMHPPLVEVLAEPNVVPPLRPIEPHGWVFRGATESKKTRVAKEN